MSCQHVVKTVNEVVSFCLPHSSALGSAAGKSYKEAGQTQKACPEPHRHPLHIVRGALLLPLWRRHTGGHVCPVPPHPAGGHKLHASAGVGVGQPGEPVAAAACSTLCDRCGLRFGYGLLPVQLSGKIVGDLGLPAGPAAH